jgi:hypothetical protein
MEERMADIIEVAKSGRATCRTCKTAIAKDTLRFGEEFTSQFADGGSHRWHHLMCAAKKFPARLKTALSSFPDPVPDREELDQAIESSAGKPKAPEAFPYADRAPTGRARCMQCEASVEKGALRVAVEREVDTGTFVSRGPGYLHPGCVASYLEKKNAGPVSDVIAPLKANSTALSASEIDQVVASL